MPFAVAVFVRWLILSIVQGTLFTAGFALLGSLLEKAKEIVQKVFDLDEEDALTTIANYTIDTTASVGITAVSLKTKLPVKIAERLGFTAKGYVKRTPSAKAQSKTAGLAKPANTTAAPTAADISTIAKEVGINRSLSFSRVNEVASLVTKIVTLTVGIPTALFFMVAQYIDFANWQGPYQKQFQALLAALGFPPDTPLPNARTISSDTWKRIYGVVEQYKPVGVSFPVSGVDKPYSRQALADLVDELAANIVLTGGQATYKNVIGLLLPLVQLSGGVSVAASAPPTTTRPAVQAVKVFTGVVTQGTLGAAVAFTERPNDLIESVDELKDSAQNNLAAFFPALPGIITYSLKIVSSVTSKDGFVQRGGTQQVVTGYKTDGTPRYKTVYNRFAVLDIFALSERGTRTKLRSIVLGPTDTVKLQPTSVQLAAVETGIKNDLFTSDIGAISGIQTAQAITVVPPEPQLPTAPTAGLVVSQPATGIFNAPAVAPVAAPRYAFAGVYYTDRNAPMQQLYRETANALLVIQPADLLLSQEEKVALKNFGNQSAGAVEKLRNMGFDTSKVSQDQNITDLRYRALREGKQFRNASLDEFFGGASPVAVANVPVPVSSSVPSVAGGASTLSEYYAAIGRSLPSIEERSKLYASLSLGIEAYYTGTAEQNTKLLAALKAGASSYVVGDFSTTPGSFA